MLRINDIVVRDGKLVLSNLPFAEGQHVQVLVDALATDKKATISDIRASLRGGVQRHDDPFEPVIPERDWEMLR